LTQLENGKFRKYGAQYHAVGVDFKLLAMEMFGATSHALAKEAAEINDTPYCTTFSYWQKRISTTVQRYRIQCQSPSTISVQNS
jgi:hypothetical protein